MMGCCKPEENSGEKFGLDGCYVLTTDLAPPDADAQTVHDRYKDLAQVEQAFRTMKTGHLEVRPVYVRTEAHTRGHVLVTMLAYLIRQELACCRADLDVTVEEGLDRLATICAQEVEVKGRPGFHTLPTPRPELRTLLDAARVALPAALPAAPYA